MMRKFIKKENLVALIIIMILMSGGIGVFATYNYLAKDIKYTDDITVADALNDLYSKSNNHKNIEIRKIDNIESTSRTYTAQLDFSNVSNYQKLTINDFYVTPSSYTAIWINSNGSHGGLSTTKSYDNSTGKLTVTLYNEDNASYRGIYFKFPAIIAILDI